MKYLYCLSMILAGGFLLQAAPLNAGADRSSLRSVSSGSRLSQNEAGKIVSLHNQIRADVGVGPLRWSGDLAAYAQQWADHLASVKCRMEHRPRSGKWRQEYGENLFIGTASHYGTADAVKAWAKEKSNYRGEAIQGSRFANVGHYTQMVWRNTGQIGCATSLCRGNLIVVCNYDPPGNYLGQRPY